jgi:hypothetical protein
MHFQQQVAKFEHQVEKTFCPVFELKSSLKLSFALFKFKQMPSSVSTLIQFQICGAIGIQTIKNVFCSEKVDRCLIIITN